jgi:hypothetical protein
VDSDGGHPDSSRQQSHAVGHREHLKAGESCCKATDRSGKARFGLANGKGAQTLFAGVVQRVTHPHFSFSLFLRPMLGPTPAKNLFFSSGGGPSNLAFEGPVKSLNTGSRNSPAGGQQSTERANRA